jgi:hypothetical protein
MNEVSTQVIQVALLLASTAVLRAQPGIESIRDPAEWTEWRTGPVPFPTSIVPAVPETLAGGPPVEFGRAGEDLAILVPRGKDKALDTLAGWLRRKAPKSLMAGDGTVPPEAAGRNWIVLGTLRDNPTAAAVLGSRASGFLDGAGPGGYRIQAFPRPDASGRTAILVLGADAQGAWRAALVFHFSLQKAGTGERQGWGPRLPDGPYWARYEARCCAASPATAPVVRASRPRVPFGIRTWNSPTQTLETYERMIRALQPTGINTIVLFPGGWQDISNAGEVCRRAVDIAWRAGIYTIFYIGNDAGAHRPAPLTPRHEAMAMAVKDHPGLLSWQLYNQLTDLLSEQENNMIREQTRWLRSISRLPIGMEVVWGHNVGPAPPNKVRLIENLLAWGIDEYHHDYAPIGGWSKGHRMELWEKRLEWFRARDIAPWALPQAHVPFRGPALPKPADLRNQFWWCVAGGARAFLFEAAYIFNRSSTRGLLTWGLEPVPDGRLEGVARLAPAARALEDVILHARPAADSDGDGSTLRIAAGAGDVAMRALRSPRGRYVLVINRKLDAEARVSCTLPQGKVEEIAPGGTMRREGSGVMLVLPPGGGVCLRIGR